jgi:ubiquinone/menaquinone biosynthesis C-methylase UbiE
MHDALGEALAKRRLKAVLPHVSGRLLDVGCGSNQLVRHYANGVGVDVHPWDGADVVVDDTATLEWESGSFDTITIVAALNHIPNRAAVLNECRRVLRPGGRVVITMLTPRTSRVWHWLRAPWDADQRDRGMKPGEVYGFTAREVIDLFRRAGFAPLSQQRFMLGLNRVYVFGMADATHASMNTAESKRTRRVARVNYS